MSLFLSFLLTFPFDSKMLNYWVRRMARLLAGEFPAANKRIPFSSPISSAFSSGPSKRKNNSARRGEKEREKVGEKSVKNKIPYIRIPAAFNANRLPFTRSFSRFT